MADISVPGITDYGSLANSFAGSLATANANNAGAQRNLADIPLIQAQTAGAQIANQRAALQLQPFRAAIAQAMGDQSGVSGDNSASPASGGDAGARHMVGDTGVGLDDLNGVAQSLYAPTPTAPPPAVMKQAQLYALGGSPEMAKMTLDQWAAQVGAYNTKKQQAADLSYQHMTNIATAPDAGEQLARLEPAVYAQLKQKYADDDPKQFEQDVRDFAIHYAPLAFQYSGRPSDMQNGVLIDKNTSKQVTGTDKVYPGMNSEQIQKTWDDLGKPVQLGDGLPHQAWESVRDPATGRPATSQQDALGIVERAARNPVSAQAPVTATSGAPGGNIVSAATAPSAAAPAAGRGAAPAAPATSSATSNDPQLTKALSDPEYRYQPPQIQRATDQASLEANKETAKTAATEYLTNANDLKKQASDTVANNQVALKYATAAQQIMQSKQVPTTGPLGSVVASLSSLPGFDKVDATNYQEVAKYLGNLALTNAKQTYGARMTQKEVDLQLNELSPSAHMTPDAINQLLKTYIENSQYEIGSAARVRKYIAAHNDPASFGEWNGKYFPRVGGAGSDTSPQSAQPAAAASASNTPATKVIGGVTYIQQNGKWYQQ